MQGQKPATTTEQKRLDLIKSLWCLPCAMDGWDGHLATIQHVVEGRARLGHDFTYGACEWHHLGIPPGSMTIADATAHYGPSLQHDLRGYEQTFAPERILVQIQNAVIQHALELKKASEYMTEDRFGLIVRQEAVMLLGRSTAISR